MDDPEGCYRRPRATPGLTEWHNRTMGESPANSSAVPADRTSTMASIRPISIAVMACLLLSACASLQTVVVSNEAWTAEPDAPPLVSEGESVEPTRSRPSRARRPAVSDRSGATPALPRGSNAWDDMEATLERHSATARAAVQSMCTGCGVGRSPKVE